MLNIDMWYNNAVEEADKITVTFYDIDAMYRGNIYKDNKIIGDYSCNDSVELEKAFPHLTFNWE